MEGVSMDHIAGFFDEMLVTGKLACLMSKFLILRKVQLKVSNCCQKSSDE